MPASGMDDRNAGLLWRSHKPIRTDCGANMHVSGCRAVAGLNSEHGLAG
jgi:hypothetical protein